MTGLAGQQHARDARRAARQLTCLLKLRAGPVQDGSWTGGRVGFGARRLRAPRRRKNLANMRPVSTPANSAEAAKANLASGPYDLPVIG